MFGSFFDRDKLTASARVFFEIGSDRLNRNRYQLLIPSRPKQLRCKNRKRIESPLVTSRRVSPPRHRRGRLPTKRMLPLDFGARFRLRASRYSPICFWKIDGGRHFVGTVLCFLRRGDRAITRSTPGGKFGANDARVRSFSLLDRPAQTHAGIADGGSERRDAKVSTGCLVVRRAFQA